MLDLHDIWTGGTRATRCFVWRKAGCRVGKEGSFGPRDEEQAVLREVLRALRQLRYGSITIIVHDCRVVQIDRTEKTRLGKETET